ncbi:MAG: hypothetical protein U1F77_00350 [Kiritimatiellia bacterium]
MTTHLARSETHGKSPMYAAWAPFAVIFLTAGFGACRARPWGGALAAFGAAAILAALFATRAAMGMTERRRVVPWHIGILISALIPLQSMWIAAAGAGTSPWPSSRCSRSTTASNASPPRADPRPRAPGCSG